MNTFKQFLEDNLLFEAFKASDFGDIYKNPTKEEFKKIPAWARGFVTKNGTLFVSGEKGSKGFHEMMVFAAKQVWSKDILFFDAKFGTFEIKNGITLQRIGKTMAFAIGERQSEDQAEPISDKELLKGKSYMKKSRKINKHVIFRPSGIINFDLPEFESGF